MNLLETLKILSDDTRYKIIELLSAQDLCVGALAKRLGITDAAVSQHLQILRKGGLLTGEKRGYWTHYSVEKAALEQAAEQLKSLSTLATARRSDCHKLTIRPTATDSIGRKKSMCKCNCEQPDKLKESPEKCSKEQIKECHGEQENHPCDGPKES
jgi:ArsR family transcriptional regulator, arsenate/arsenite/antimonite-responsive transcriptional repressor